jgi:hypothetical protein
MLAEGLDVFRPGAIADGGRMIPSSNLSFAEKKKKLWLDRCLRVEPRGVVIALANASMT